MQSTLIKLWNGNIVPCDEITAHSQEIGELFELLERNQNNLEAHLDIHGKESLKKWLDCQDELNGLECEDAFVKGFSLGVKFLVEVYSG